MDASERISHGEYATLDDALVTCRSIVDDFLASQFKLSMLADDLFDLYAMFGEDPFIVALDPKEGPIDFSAWDYAERRCQEITSMCR